MNEKLFVCFPKNSPDVPQNSPDLSFFVSRNVESSFSKFIQYCAIETGGENEIPFHFPHLFHTNSIFVKQFSHIFPGAGEINFPVGGFCFTITETQFANFHLISP